MWRMERHVPCRGGGNSLKPSHNHGLWPRCGLWVRDLALTLAIASGCLSDVVVIHFIQTTTLSPKGEIFKYPQLAINHDYERVLRLLPPPTRNVPFHPPHRALFNFSNSCDINLFFIKNSSLFFSTT